MDFWFKKTTVVMVLFLFTSILLVFLQYQYVEEKGVGLFKILTFIENET